ncbi:MAG: exosortase/archaeosortase family protein [Planctomycetota bacterium]|nr:exosortase/archaeosortase family protein [Planctomycetota bacterium]
MIPRTFSRNGWTIWHLLGALAMLALGVWITRDAWQDMYRIASRDEESTHIFLVPLVAAWLVFVRRGRLRLCLPRGAWLGPVIIVVGWLIHSVGDLHMIQSFYHGGAVLVAVGCVLSVTGSDIFLRFMPAFAVLVFLVPVPGSVRQQIAIPLQTHTAKVTQVLFELADLPVGISGNVLSINGVEVAIAEACNGLRMVFALVLVSYAFAFGTPLRSYVRVLILVASPASAVACNVVRLLPTVWLYGYYPSIADKFHDISGWVMLPLAFFLLLGVIRVLRWALVPVTHYTLAYEY